MTTLAAYQRMSVRVSEIEPGDKLVSPGFIPLIVTSVRIYPSHRFAVAHYDCATGSGARTLCADSTVEILRRPEEAIT